MKLWNLLKPWLARKVHAQLYSIFVFCSIITTQLPSTSLKSELQFLSVSASVYCKPIDRILKMLFTEASDSFLRPIIPELWKLLAFG